ncbi:MAG: hypothetical protein WCD76_10000 [Pyrinomonadaceae bacterium]
MSKATRFTKITRTETSTKLVRIFLALTCASLMTFAAGFARGQEKGGTAAEAKAATASSTNGGNSSQIVREGISFEFQVAPVASASGKAKPSELIEGEDAMVRFKVTYATTKAPLTGLKLSAWMSLRDEGAKAPELKDCREKAQSYIQGSMGARPDVDLNSYYVLALNSEPNISVIDPLVGFGGSKLLTLVMLPSPGADWVLTKDAQKLFVSMPLVNKVAVVDTATWKVISTIDAGVNPTRIRLQPDERYLWVGDDGAGPDGGVAVIEMGELKKVATVVTGTGHHEIGFSDDSRYAFVTNQQDGTLTVVDVQKFGKLSDIKVGANPQSIAVSSLSKAVYVTSESEGTISVVDAASHRLLARLRGKPGLRAVRFAPDGRYGFALNPKENGVLIFDASANQIIHDVQLGRAPDQVSFTDTFAYIRSTSSEEVKMIRLSTIGKELDFAVFPGGQLAPNKSEVTSFADAIVPAPEGNSVLVANPADKLIYYYSEGMAAPMGNFQNYRREPKSVMVIDRSLREGLPGIYSTIVKLPRYGVYDVAFLADSPRVFHCFEVSAKANPALPKNQAVALRIEYLTKERKMRVGESASIRFKLYDTATNQPKEGLKDVRVLAFLAPGIWQQRQFARSVGGGIYEVSLTPPQPGIYQVFVQSASQFVRFTELPSLTLHAEPVPVTSPPTMK